MKKIFFITILFFGFFCLTRISQATTSVNCSFASTVNTALNIAASGDTIVCTMSGWSSGTVTFPSTKNLTLDGSGYIVGGTISIPSSASYAVRVTNFTFTSTGAISTADGYTNSPWRIDHCSFRGNGTLLDLGNSPGLIDNCHFINLSLAQETIHIWGWYPGNISGWTNPDTPGSVQAIYFEDNTVTGAQGNSTCLFQTYYGGRVVARYNTIDSAMFDVHGNTAYSGRWWEFYNNSWSGNNSTMCLRGGSGIVFGNTGSGNIFLVEEVAAGTDQVGRGQNFYTYPAYIWNNVSFSTNLNSEGCAPAISGVVQLNRDVFYPSSEISLPLTCATGQSYWKTDAGGNWDTIHGGSNDGMLYKCTSTNTWTSYYTPYTYPHPLRQIGNTAPAAPTGVRVV